MSDGGPWVILRESANGTPLAHVVEHKFNLRYYEKREATIVPLSDAAAAPALRAVIESVLRDFDEHGPNVLAAHYVDAMRSALKEADRGEA